jgi:hypothetical protein
LSTSVGPQIDVTLHSVFASRKRNTIDEEKGVHSSNMLPSNFQVYAKIDEETRKDNQLVASFLVTLNDVRGSVTYEFRGTSNVTGSTADFESIMGAQKDSRVPKILDTIYQRLYPVIFMLAGMTTSSYPQSVALMTEMVASEPIQIHQEVAPAALGEDKSKENEPTPKVMEPKVAEAPKPTISKMKKQPQSSLSEGDSAKVAVAK